MNRILLEFPDFSDFQCQMQQKSVAFFLFFSRRDFADEIIKKTEGQKFVIVDAELRG